jgi:scyllo-inositol 2-dehydrogenase (NADP+)
MIKKIGVGIIGCGFGARHHGAKLTKEYTEKFRLIAFCDVNKERLDSVCKEFDIKGYTDVDSMLTDKSIELIIVATRPHSTHFPIVLKALQTGKHVIVEKPMCIIPDECRKMLQTRDTLNKILTVHHNRRWDLDYLNIKQVIEDGTLGELKLLKSYYPAGFGEKESLYEWGSHLIDQVLRLAGGLPEKVLGTLGYPDNEWDKQGFFSVQMLYKSGLIAEVSSIPQGKPFIMPRFYLLGTKGSLVHDWVQRKEDVMLKHMIFQSADKEPGFDFLRPRYYSNPEWKIPSYYDNIYDAIRNGVELKVKPEHGLETSLVMEGIIKSARSKDFILIKKEK